MIGRVAVCVGVLAAWASALWPATAIASDRPTVFLHGFAAEAGDWVDTADRLRRTVAIDPRIPSLDWRAEFENQARGLQQSEYGPLAATTVAVGHSNGGLVAREWSKLHGLGGIVTIGTPHGGAPILQHLLEWYGFNDTTLWAIDDTLRAFSVPTDWWWVPAAINDYLHFTSKVSVLAITELVTALGVQGTAPVAFEMLPGSSFLNALNGSSNLGLETGRVPARVGIVSVAHNYYWAGIARATRPEQADTIAALLYGTGGGLLAYGNLILASSDPADWASIDQGLALTTVAMQLFSIDPVYCQLVSHPGRGVCLPSDGVVPIDRQAYPGAPNLYIEGPAHKQEKQQSEDVLYYALVNYVGLPPRVAAPVPSQDPPPPDSGSDTGPVDGDGSGDVGTSGDNATGGPITIETGELLPQQILEPGDTLNSTSGRLHFTYQDDGNLVLYNDYWEPLWASGTHGYSAGVVAMQDDGNLVVYDADGVPQWASGTAGYPGAKLAVQDDGNVVIYVDGSPIWATNTFID